MNKHPTERINSVIDRICTFNHRRQLSSSIDRSTFKVFSELLHAYIAAGVSLIIADDLHA